LWRKGPDGPLCNACGLQHSRRKRRALVGAEHATPLALVGAAHAAPLALVGVAHAAPLALVGAEHAAPLALVGAAHEPAVQHVAATPAFTPAKSFSLVYPPKYLARFPYDYPRTQIALTAAGVSAGRGSSHTISFDSLEVSNVGVFFAPVLGDLHCDAEVINNTPLFLRIHTRERLLSYKDRTECCHWIAPGQTRKICCFDIVDLHAEEVTNYENLVKEMSDFCVELIPSD